MVGPIILVRPISSSFRRIRPQKISSLHRRDRDGALLACAGRGILGQWDMVLGGCTSEGGNTATGSSRGVKGLRHRWVARMPATILVFSSLAPFSAPPSSLNSSSPASRVPLRRSCRAPNGLRLCSSLRAPRVGTRAPHTYAREEREYALMRAGGACAGFAR
jgi:hypothetical protein